MLNHSNQQLKRRRPEVSEVNEFLEITRDFTDPRDAVREAISNAMDWGATKIEVSIEEDKTRPDEEIVISVKDNGLGMNEVRLESFFDLGNSIQNMGKIGYKGHGTKTYYNSRAIEVWSDAADCSIYAIMDSPLHTLMTGHVPEYSYDIEQKENTTTGTRIIIRGYNMNQNRRDFGHNVLRDYVLWFTRFGSTEKEIGIEKNSKSILQLRGLGRDNLEEIKYGHPFPKENADIKKLMKQRPGDWTRVFVKKWIFKDISVIDNPGKTVNIVFFVEGDEAKRSYNPMLRVRGRTPEYGMYKVEDRYGLWVSKDHIPIKRYNEWLGLGQRLETKYHAFVNSQDFRLTANRGDIGNTPPDLLRSIESTVRQVFEEKIIGGKEYQEYEEAAEQEQQYQTAGQELKDFARRQKRAKSKRVVTYKRIDLLEPGVEMGVVALFNQMYALKPGLFPFHVIDYDTRKGYDALVVRGSPADLSKESVFFVEFKYVLSDKPFNHSFDHLISIICWDCVLSDGAELRDIQDKHRELKILKPKDRSGHTRYILSSPAELHNIEVIVLKDFLKEKLHLEFSPRTKK